MQLPLKSNKCERKQKLANTFSPLLTKFTSYIKKLMFKLGNLMMIIYLLNIRCWSQTVFCETPNPYEKKVQKCL